MQSIEERITAAKERRAAHEAEEDAEKKRREQEKGEEQRATLVRLYGSLVEALDMQIDSGGAMFEFRGRQYHLCEMYDGAWHLARYSDGAWHLVRHSDDDAHLSPSAALHPTHSNPTHNRDELLLALDTLSAQPEVPSVEISHAPRAMTAREEQFLAALRGFIQDTM